MSGIAGIWDCVSSTPMGDRNSVMHLQCDGTTVTGTVVLETETIPIVDGQFDGSTFTWKMKLTEPFKMSMSGAVKVDGDGFSGDIGAMLGKSDIRGTRRAA